MASQYNYTVSERFLRYVKIDTQSDPDNAAFPSSEKQKDLSRLLVQELLEIGVKDAAMDENGYVYGTIEGNTDKNVPVICFCSHVDTAPDCSGTDVKPIVHENYNGQDIILPDDPDQIIRMEDYPYLKTQLGKSIITASGKTLLGGDDKSGVAIIMDMAHYLLTHPQHPHGTIKILFTPDEETGRGTEKVDLKRVGADFGYTLDGGELGSFEDETFSADSAKMTVHGIIAHPGYAKGKLVNALKIVGEILAALPKNEFSPETTSGREGFVHPVKVEGIAEAASIDFIVRDFVTDNLQKHEARLKQIAQSVTGKYPGVKMDFTVKEQYRNMKEVLDKYPQVAQNAIAAYKNLGIKVINEPVRGGTDGSRLSFMGFPCPNIFTGMQAIHSRHEWIGIEDMHRAVDVLVELTKVWEENA
ncbi:tripeptide aminopeptidase [Arachidicoccus rhizosphaerae]|uniref:Peptidase T n=1 Tax=Arachidicoccus rhizosphaerae TaxID=551991 RepID=A0A1H3WR51_9BACT|nr:peptidase T [Arachidicoccus rhizosphaerae]SDZ89231.1 tripeptide aminopeptidase [Arachidicoccus rhizosphaerae]